MNCQDCRDRLSAMLDRELAAEELEDVMRHLQQCDGCCRECALLCCVDAAVSMVESPETPPGLRSRLDSYLSIPAGSAADQPVVAGSKIQPEVLIPEEAASYLRLTLVELLESLDVLPHARLGEHVRFRRSALEAWIGSQEKFALPDQSGIRDAPVSSNVTDLGAARVRRTRMGHA